MSVSNCQNLGRYWGAGCAPLRPSAALQQSPPGRRLRGIAGCTCEGIVSRVYPFSVPPLCNGPIGRGVATVQAGVPGRPFLMGQAQGRNERLEVAGGHRTVESIDDSANLAGAIGGETIHAIGMTDRGQLPCSLFWAAWAAVTTYKSYMGSYNHPIQSFAQHVIMAMVPGA